MVPRDARRRVKPQISSPGRSFPFSNLLGTGRVKRLLGSGAPLRVAQILFPQFNAATRCRNTVLFRVGSLDLLQKDADFHPSPNRLRLHLAAAHGLESASKPLHKIERADANCRRRR